MYVWRKGVNSHHTLFLNVFNNVHCYSEKGSQNQHFQSTLLVGKEGTQKKSTLCSLVVENSG